MAPRGRPSKVGLKRRDAAIAAMLELGFSRKLINQTIKELLQVYGGDEGWRFIEMDSYRVLIDAILEKGEPEAAASSQVDDEGVENSHRQSEVGSSSETLAPVVDTYTAPLPSLVGDGLDSGSRVEAVQNPPLIIPQSAEEGKGAGEPDNGTPSSKLQPPPFSKSERISEQPARRVSCVSPCNDFTLLGEELEGAGKPDNTDGDADKGTPNPESPCVTEQLAPYVPPHRNRRPFHGLVRDNNDDESDLVRLERAPLPEALLKILGRTVPLKRKSSRWDVKPQLVKGFAAG